MRYYQVFGNLFDDFFTTDLQGASSIMKTDIVEKDGRIICLATSLYVYKQGIALGYYG